MTFNVLVAEPGDQPWALIANGIRKQRPDASLLRVKDGEQALRFLFHRGLLTDAPETPDLVVLADTLPALSVQILLERLRQHPRTCMTPVIVVDHGQRDDEVAPRFEPRPALDEQEVDGQQIVTLSATSRAADLQRAVARAVRHLCGEPLTHVSSPGPSQGPSQGPSLAPSLGVQGLRA